MVDGVEEVVSVQRSGKRVCSGVAVRSVGALQQCPGRQLRGCEGGGLSTGELASVSSRKPSRRRRSTWRVLTVYLEAGEKIFLHRLRLDEVAATTIIIGANVQNVEQKNWSFNALDDWRIVVDSASDEMEERHPDEARVRACDATFGPKCDRAARVKDDATLVSGEIAVTGKVKREIVMRDVAKNIGSDSVVDHAGAECVLAVSVLSWCERDRLVPKSTVQEVTGHLSTSIPKTQLCTVLTSSQFTWTRPPERWLGPQKSSDIPMSFCQVNVFFGRGETSVFDKCP